MELGADKEEELTKKFSHPNGSPVVVALVSQVGKKKIEAFLSPGGAFCHALFHSPTILAFLFASHAAIAIPEPVMGGETLPWRVALFSPEPNVQKHTPVT